MPRTILSALLLSSFLCVDLAAQGPPIRVEFAEPAYENLVGQDFQTSVRINPLPVVGLFSYGLIVTVEGGDGLLGMTTLIPESTLLFDGILGPGSRGVTTAAGRFTAKGSTDFFSAQKPNHMETTLGNVNIAGLTEGSYLLGLNSYNTLGPTESIFVDGACQSLDPFLSFGRATLNIVSRPTGTIAAGPMRAERQTGLLLQEVTITNTSAASVVFNLYVKNLPAGTTLWNARGEFNGVPYVKVPGEGLAPGASVKLTLEYRSHDRATVPVPIFELDRAAPQEGKYLATAEQVLNPRGSLANGDFLLEFDSEAGKSYLVTYSHDNVKWTDVRPKIEGTGNRIQWIDNGPPKTESHPSAVGSRFYRIYILSKTQ